MKAIFCTVWMSCFTLLLQGQQHTPADSAVLYFDQKQYDQAIAIWSTVPHPSAAVYFNLGLAYSKNGQTAEAVLAFEKAIRLQPHNRKIQIELQQIKSQIPDRVTPIESFFFIRWYHCFISFLRPGIWSLIGLVIVLAGILSMYKMMQTKVEKQQKKSYRSVSILMAGLLCIVIAGLSYSRLYRTNEAVVFDATTIQQAASHESPALREINAGETVVIKDQIGPWYQVQLANLDLGWIESDRLRRITIP